VQEVVLRTRTVHTDLGRHLGQNTWTSEPSMPYGTSRAAGSDDFGILITSPDHATVPIGGGAVGEAHCR